MDDNEEVSDELYAKLNLLIKQYDPYEVEVIKHDKHSLKVKIPSVYKEIASFL